MKSYINHNNKIIVPNKLSIILNGSTTIHTYTEKTLNAGLRIYSLDNTNSTNNTINLSCGANNIVRGL